MRIPEFLNRDDYLQNPILRRFLKDHRISFVENRADYIREIEAYSERDERSAAEVRDWLLHVIKEGSKEICYKKVRSINEWHRDPVLLEAKIQELYPDCPRETILTYTNTAECKLIDYTLITNEENMITKIELTFSKLFLYGESGKLGNATVFPVFIEVYLDSGFIVSRAKAKSTLYEYSDTNEFLTNEYRVDTMRYAMSIVDQVCALLGFETAADPRAAKSEIERALYGIYNKYSFTPENVANQVGTQEVTINEFVNQVFENLQLDPRNKEAAILDARILVEKFISINGNNERLFKEDRPAYLIKVSTDDELDQTKIDTTSNKLIPLQCTEAFFDGKKTVVKSRQCKRLDLIFKRNNETYFSSNPLVVQFGTYKGHGYIKTMQYAEEADIQNVLRAIFENY